MKALFHIKLLNGESLEFVSDIVGTVLLTTVRVDNQTAIPFREIKELLIKPLETPTDIFKFEGEPIKHYHKGKSHVS